MRTAIVYSAKYLEHKTGISHPEKPQRLKVIMNGIMRKNLPNNSRVTLIEPRYASLDELQLVHTREYIDRVRLICELGGGLVGDETPVSRESFEVSRLAVGGVIKAVQEVMSGNFNNAFALVRPPGHHAGPNYSMGFCIFNNVALAAKYLIERYGFKRILIFDIDAHHGNGTQEIFFDTRNILYVSIHEDPIDFPGTGFVWEVGVNEGEGCTVNIPLPFGSGDPPYWKAFKTIVLPVINQYRPQFILISAGFDGYYRDNVSELALSAFIYPKLFQTMLEISHRLCNGRLVAVLEGGYNLWFLKKIVAACIFKMAGLDIRVKDRRPPINIDAQKGADKIIRNIKRIQSRYWSL
ncbi:MAG: histone deacetylase [Candidatus Bathyarchaeia archaeon]